MEKVSLKTVKEEKTQNSLEQNEFLIKMVDLAIQMTPEERLKAIEFLNKKIASI